MDIRKDGASMTPKLQPLLDAAEIASCPFCGFHAGNMPRVIRRRAPKLGRDRYHYWVKHPMCGAEGGHGLTEEQAIEKWNRRAPPSLELRLREYVGELEADCADKGIAQPIAAAIRREIADRLKSLMEGKP